jgi:hypothetical protein
LIKLKSKFAYLFYLIPNQVALEFKSVAGNR